MGLEKCTMFIKLMEGTYWYLWFRTTSGCENLWVWSMVGVAIHSILHLYQPILFDLFHHLVSLIYHLHICINAYTMYV